MKLNTNSNSYIVIYSTVMVVVVAALLATTALALQPRQKANKLNENKQSILSSLGAVDQNYDAFISGFAMDAQGNKIEGVDVFAQLQDLKGSFASNVFPLFEAKDGRVVIPVTGTGLWGPIWGYVALNSDMDTVAGVVIDHSGETPGLGAEIATPKHWAAYVGKKIFDEQGNLVSISLRKGGASAANIDHEIDAISGGTKTSDGVSAMFKQSLDHYLPYLESRRAAVSETTPGTITQETVLDPTATTEDTSVEAIATALRSTADRLEPMDENGKPYAPINEQSHE